MQALPEAVKSKEILKLKTDLRVFSVLTYPSIV